MFSKKKQILKKTFGISYFILFLIHLYWVNLVSLSSISNLVILFTFLFPLFYSFLISSFIVIYSYLFEIKKFSILKRNSLFILGIIFNLTLIGLLIFLEFVLFVLSVIG